MNIFLWMLAGGAAGWIGYTYLGYSEARGMIASVVVGALGGFIGGNIIAPMFVAAAPVASDFSPVALMFAVAVAAAFLFVGNIISNRWGV